MDEDVQNRVSAWIDHVGTGYMALAGILAAVTNIQDLLSDPVENLQKMARQKPYRGGHGSMFAQTKVCVHKQATLYMGSRSRSYEVHIDYLAAKHWKPRERASR